MKRKRNRRKLKAVQAAERSRYAAMALGAALAGLIAAMFIWLTPVYSVRDMAIAQAIRTPPTRLASNSMATSPIHGSAISASPNLAQLVDGAAVFVSSNEAVAEPLKMTASGPARKNAHRDIGFDRLAGFNFYVTDEMLNDTGDALGNSEKILQQIPPTIKELNEKQVTVKGFMLPLSVYHGQATEFLLLKNQGMCCYGTIPKMNEWVTVRMPGAGVKPVMDRLVSVTGTFYVGEMRDDRLLTSIYRLDADKTEVVSQP